MKTKYELAEEIWEGIKPKSNEDNLNSRLAVILGLVFYKYLSDNFKQKYKNIYENDFTEVDCEFDRVEIDEIKDSIGYFIHKRNLFEEWSSDVKLKNISIGQLQEVFKDLENEVKEISKEIYGPIITFIKGNINSLSSKEIDRNNIVQKYISEVKKIEYTSLTKLEYHKYIFSYLLKNLTLATGRKSDISFTPDDISSLIARLTSLNFQDINLEAVNFYDPTCGSSSLLIRTIKYLEKTKNIKLNKVYAQDINEFPSIISRMNFIINDIESTKIYIDNSDCLKKDWLEKKDIFHKEFDVITFNPSYSASCDFTKSLKNDDRFLNYSIPSSSQAVYAFILHSLYYLKNNGSMVCLMPHGVLFRGNNEGQIRQKLIENKYIDAVIGLPANLSYGTNIATVILVFKKNRTSDDILFIDASNLYIKGKDKNTLGEGYISQICDLYKQRKDVDGLSRVVNLDKIKENNFNLNISLYLDNYKTEDANNIYCSVFGGIPNYEIKQLRDDYPQFSEVLNHLFETSQDQNYYSRFNDGIKFNIKDFDSIKMFIKKHSNSYDVIIKQIKELLNFEKISSNSGQVDFDEVFDKIKMLIIDMFSNDKLVNVYEVIKMFFEHLLELENSVTSVILDRDILRKKYEMIFRNKSYDKLYLDLTEVKPDLFISPIHLLERYNSSDILDIKKLYEEYQLLSNEKDQYLEENYFVLENNLGDKGKILIKKIKSNLKSKDDIDPIEYEVFNKVVDFFKDLEYRELDIKNKTKSLYDKYSYLVENIEIEELYKIMLDLVCDTFKLNLNLYLDNIIDSFSQKIDKLLKKYKTALYSLQYEIEKNEADLLNKLNDIGECFDEYDKKGLDEIINILGGNINE